MFRLWRASVVGIIGLAVLAGTLTARADSRSAPPAELVERLDRAFQYRFATVNQNIFGISRIPTVPQHPELRVLKLDTPEETAVVQGLKELGWDGAFMVVSAVALQSLTRAHKLPPRASSEQAAARAAAPTGSAPRSRERHPAGLVRRVVSAPLYLTEPKPSAPLPAEDLLLPRLLKADPDPRRIGARQFTIGGWVFDVRPIPAGKTQCLSCHKRNIDGSLMKLGDPLGLALYAFHKAPASR